MSVDRTRLERLLAAVSDDAKVDWDNEAGAAEDEAERRLVQSLGVIAKIADLHGEEPAPSLADGNRVGRFEITELIGRGAHGEVYRAKDPHLAREVALKIFVGERWSDPCRGADIPAFVSEARRLASVRHPNVVTIHAVESLALTSDVSHPALVMEHIPGDNLADFARAQGPLGAAEVASIGMDLCRALAAVHRGGLIHQDVKAQNVRRETGGRIVLMDFGPGGRTPIYSAPELFTGAPTSAQSDLYALGVLLFFLATLRFPVDGSTIGELAYAHASGKRTRLRDLRPDIPSALVGAIDGALQPDATTRVASAGELEELLSRCLRPELTEATARDGARAPRTVRSITWATVGAALLTTLVLLLRRQPDDPVARETLLGGSGLMRPFTIEAALFAGHEQHRRLEDGAVIALGDSLSLVLESSDSLHVYIVNEDRTGAAFLLYPNAAFAASNPVVPGRHVLPGGRSGKSTYWRVTSAGGEERILVVASRRPLPSLDADALGLDPLEANRSLEYPSLPGEAMAELRGIGGFVEREDRGGEEARRQIFGLAEPLAKGPERVSGVWIRRIELKNPAR